MKLITLFAVLCTLISLSYAQTTYNYSFLSNFTCHPVELDGCYPCQAASSERITYFKLFSDPPGSTDLAAQQYTDSSCTNFYSSEGIYYERCENNIEDCVFYATKSSITIFTLSLSSTAPIVTSLLGDEIVYAEISSNKISAEGEDLTGVQVHSAGKTFFIESQVSETEYSTSIGVFSFGTQYTRSPFTFSAILSTLNAPNFEIDRAIENDHSVGFSPFFAAYVTNDNVYPTYKPYSGQINVLVDSDLDLDGLVVSNPLYAAVNMTLYPPFSGNNKGQLVFQVDTSRDNAPFVTVQCYYEELSDSVVTDKYHCSLGSLSGIIHHSVSLPLDEFGERIVAKPDEMSFSLF